MNQMHIQEKVPLTNYSTMRLGGEARYLVKISSEEELLETINFAQTKELPIKMIGGGSNIIFTDNGFSGVIAVNDIKGISIHTQGDSAILTVGAGELWDKVVEYSVQQGLSGIEALSLIPGSTGATPVQNVGAYGQELKDSLISLRAWDSKHDQWKQMDNKECKFDYRRSIFNSTAKNRFYITQIQLKLSSMKPKPPFYKSVQDYLDIHKITQPSNRDIREAVVHIRQSKLPDPQVLPNSGSFFKNPVIPTDRYNKLKVSFPDMPGYKQINGTKISAAWLVDKAGLKGFQANGFSTYVKQPLVITNLSGTSQKELTSFRDTIANKVLEKFDIELEQEPEIVYDSI